MNVPGDGRSGIRDAGANGDESPNPIETTPGEPAVAGRPAPRPDRKRLAEIFGDTLFPDLTSDELDDPAERSGDTTAWLNENRPPHHDR
ncbi:MAG: hypothetical protein ACR2P2_21720 [Nakamurella sp.]